MKLANQTQTEGNGPNTEGIEEESCRAQEGKMEEEEEAEIGGASLLSLERERRERERERERESEEIQGKREKGICNVKR